MSQRVRNTTFLEGVEPCWTLLRRNLPRQAVVKSLVTFNCPAIIGVCIHWLQAIQWQRSGPPIPVSLPVTKFSKLNSNNAYRFDAIQASTFHSLIFVET